MKSAFLRKSILLLNIFVLVFIIISGCKKDDQNNVNPTENKQVEKLITASVGGTLTTSDSLKLTIPPYALTADGNVFIGRTGNEPSSVPNENLKIAGTPITIKIPSDSILKAIQLSFPKPSNSLDTNNYSIFLFNGSTYFPVEYSLTETKVIVSIDIINWESDNKKGALLLNEIIIIGLISEQTPPASELGLKKVSLISGEMIFETPTANSSSRVLLLVHGWTGRACTWNNFMTNIGTIANPEYSEFWTFVYNSSWSIKTNAKLLSDKLKIYSNGAQIDIVAHSMGGLVSRSMIEQFDGAQYVNRLITLGTPHKGSPLAVFRYLMGGYVALTNPGEAIIYNYFTQGFRDLNTNSSFINEMETLIVPPIPYYTIASTNDPNASPRNLLEVACTYTYKILPGPDDGMVSVSSAIGVPGSTSPDLEYNIPVILAHMDMPKDSKIFNKVIEYLQSGKPSLSTNAVTEFTQSSSKVGGNVISDGGLTITERGVYYSTSQNPETTGIKLPIGSGTGTFSTTITGLTPGTTYYIKAYAINSQGPSYGNQVTFTTISENQTGTVTDIDGNVYKTVTIGAQTWIAENLKASRYNDGTAIPNVTVNATWAPLTYGAYGDYSNTPANSTTYGRLYNWYAIDNNAASMGASNGGKNVCPTGWHVPSETEWMTLANYLGGESIAGGKLKEAGTVHWQTPNTGATNETGFTALPGGSRDSAGLFGGIGGGGGWWSSTGFSASDAYYLLMYSSNSYMRSYSDNKHYGFSVRCLKD
jgi:uncharacterized protein (TIGR02145 family)